MAFEFDWKVGLVSSKVVWGSWDSIRSPLFEDNLMKFGFVRLRSIDPVIWMVEIREGSPHEITERFEMASEDLGVRGA